VNVWSNECKTYANGDSKDRQQKSGNPKYEKPCHYGLDKTNTRRISEHIPRGSARFGQRLSKVWTPNRLNRNGRSKNRLTIFRKMSAIPLWLSRRLPYLKKTGVFSIASESQFDPSYLSLPAISKVLTIVRELDISHLQISTLANFPQLPHLCTFIADHSGISDFTNFKCTQSTKTFSLKNTPVSKLSTYRISLLLAVGLDSVASIDGTQISPKLRAKVTSYPKECSELVNRGWIAGPHPPTRAEIAELCHQYSLDVGRDFDDDDEEELVSPLESTRRNTDLESLDFELLLATLIGEHESVLRRGQGIFGIIDDDSFEMNDRIISMIQSHGIPLVDRSDDGILSTVERMLARSAPTVPS
jgi:hypothetical protein